MTVNVQIKYPVITYTPKFIIGGINDEKSFTQYGKKQYENGCLKNAEVIDAEGVHYNLVGSTPSSKQNNWNIYNYFPDGMFKDYKDITVDIELEKTEKLNIDKVKEILLILIEKNKWYKSADGRTLEDIKEMFDSARTMHELNTIIEVFS